MAFNKDEFKEAVDDSQIAYLHCIQKGYMALYDGSKNYPTLEQVIKASMGTVDYYRAYRKALTSFKTQGKDIKDITIEDVVQYSTIISDADKKRISELDPETFSYKIQDVYDVQEYNGFYACFLDKGNGEKTIAIRGSEDFTRLRNFRNDWRDNDFGLVKSEETSQQKEMRFMLQYLRDSHQLDDCDKLTIAGHSLGGNLASHAAIVLQEEGFEDINKKLYKAYNLDGPGVSQKYLDYHKEKINKVGDRDIIQHAKWSVVGNLLFDIPTSYTRNIKTNAKKLDKFIGYKDTTVLGQLKRLFCKHSTVCVTPLDHNKDDWNIEETDEDALSKTLGKASRAIDAFIPEPITYAVGTISAWLAEKILVKPEKDIEPDKKPTSSSTPNFAKADPAEEAVL